MNKQITEDYCSFEIAKLLKEKRFDELCIKKYNKNGFLQNAGNKIEEWQNSELDEDEFSAPTHQMALKWLREVHDLHILVYPWQADNEEKAIHWCCTVYKAFAHLGNDVYTNETEFVKDKRKTHCKDCMNENGFCGAQDVLMCWLQKTYLPKGEWGKAMMSDMETKAANEFSGEVNKRILEKILKK